MWHVLKALMSHVSWNLNLSNVTLLTLFFLIPLGGFWKFPAGKLGIVLQEFLLSKIPLRRPNPSPTGFEEWPHLIGTISKGNYVVLGKPPILFGRFSQHWSLLECGPINCGHSSKPAGIGLGKFCFHREILLSRISWRTIPNSPAGNF